MSGEAKFFNKWKSELIAIFRSQGETILVEKKRAPKESGSIPFSLTRMVPEGYWLKDFEAIFGLPLPGTRLSIEKLFEGCSKFEVGANGTVRRVEPK